MIELKEKREKSIDTVGDPNILLSTSDEKTRQRIIRGIEKTQKYHQPIGANQHL